MKMIMLENFDFVFDEKIVLHVFSLLDIGLEPTEVSKRLKLAMRDVFIIMIEWSDVRGKWREV